MTRNLIYYVCIDDQNIDGATKTGEKEKMAKCCIHTIVERTYSLVICLQLKWMVWRRKCVWLASFISHRCGWCWCRHCSATATITAAVVVVVVCRYCCYCSYICGYRSVCSSHFTWLNNATLRSPCITSTAHSTAPHNMV